MAKIVLTVEADGPADLLATVSALALSLGGSAAPAPEVTATSTRRQRTAPPAARAEPAPAAAQDPETPAETEGDDEEAALLAELEANGGEPAAVTMDDLKKAMHAAIAKSGTKTTLGALRDACEGASKLADLKPEQFGAAHAALLKLA